MITRVSILLALVLTLLNASAQSANEFYVRIYNTIQEADTLSSNMQNAAALQKYREAQTALQTFKNGNPGWNPNIINFRLSYVADRIADISSKLPPGQLPAEPPPQQPQTPDPLQNAAATAMEGQVNVLRDQVRLLQADRAKLEAKLKEALSVQPSAVDPRELAKAEQKIQQLQKENDLLKVNLEQAKSRPAEADRAELDRANSTITEYKEMITRLTSERTALQQRLKTSSDSDALRAENELLKKQLADSKTYETRLAALKSDNQLLLLEKKALEQKISQLSKSEPPKDTRSITELERERDDLRKQLESATKELASRSKNTKGRVRELETEVANLKQRIEVFQSRAVPYTAEELALFNKPQPTLAKPATSSTAPEQKPPQTTRFTASTAALTKEAERHYAAGRLKEAEQKFSEAVKQDKTDVVSLANLAVVELDLKQFGDAEKHIKAALAIAPEDAFSLGVLGRLRWQQKKLDEALDALSRAAKIDPENAEIQNYLGLVLSDKGMRAPAESALRKAVQLRPGYGSAHQNLAVVYVTQNPPLVELARFHYSKSLSAGAPANPDLEKLIASKSPR